MKALASAIMAGVGMILPCESRAAVDFIFNFTDAPGVGFNAAGQVGADRRASLDIAAGVLESYLANYNATINIDVNGGVTNDTTLASASSNLNLAFPGNGFGTRGDVMIKILGGADPSPGADGQVNWNFEDFVWEPYSDFQPGELDLQSTATHELTHALGFASGISQSGGSPWGDAGGTPSAWNPFDQWVADSTGSIIDGGTFALSLSRWNVASTGGTGPINGLLFQRPERDVCQRGKPGAALFSDDLARGKFRLPSGHRLFHRTEREDDESSGRSIRRARYSRARLDRNRSPGRHWLHPNRRSSRAWDCVDDSDRGGFRPLEPPPAGLSREGAEDIRRMRRYTAPGREL